MQLLCRTRSARPTNRAYPTPVPTWWEAGSQLRVSRGNLRRRLPCSRRLPEMCSASGSLSGMGTRYIWGVVFSSESPLPVRKPSLRYCHWILLLQELSLPYRAYGECSWLGGRQRSTRA
ncbi:hypothetical protein FOIG_16838 [Fusarium odoratissimum NRRL 54006]|uniref:Uncharacterized protein n=1 Tax=Fusarium odoratissimum (strain NRRL 54006) TaxID=1089451 RepID=X0JYE8_FUSO5|nr:uncharacterized protein FOIG_16838 [Fusarium odoratissimum NRRL 54006]EXL89879.1 hypothetical protein FOIG_16838 [Fusarium odoratissimum NRRL 54006]